MTKLYKFILEASRPYRFYLFLALGILAYIAAQKNIYPYIVKTIVDRVTTHNYDDIWVVFTIYAICQVSITFAWRGFDWCYRKYGPQMRCSVTAHFVEKLGKYPFNYFQNELSGRLASKINDIAYYTPQIISTVIIELLQISVMLVITLALLANVHYFFALAMIIWLAIFVTIFLYRIQKVEALSRSEAEVDSKILGEIVDYLANIFSVKIFAGHKFELKKLGSTLSDYQHKSITKGLYLQSLFFAQGIIFSIYILSCLTILIHLCRSGLISAGDFALVFMLNMTIVDWMFNLTHEMKDFINNIGISNQALADLDRALEIKESAHSAKLKIKQGQIIFDKVKFHYKNTIPLFEDKSIIIEPGQKVGLVGYSGSGKSTFVNLILRLYEVSDGKILIDGQDIKSITLDSLRVNIAMIPQDPSLFHRSLMDNIRYGKLDASDEEVIEAAKKAGADEFIQQLPEKYEVLVGERGIKLSGGQRQRVAIARAILKNAPILILDEATSQLDSITENQIQESLWRLMQHKTTLIVAHRLSTLLDMDRILVFDNGKIVQDGSHNELLKKGGLYKTLWDAQVGGFLPEKRS